MKQAYIAVVVILLASLTAGCDRLSNAAALNSKIDDLSSKLAEAEKKVDSLHNENESLKEQLSRSTDKDKKNLERLFR